MKNKFLCLFLSLILILSFPIVTIGANNSETKDISGYFDADMIVTDGNRTRLSTYTDILYGENMPTTEFDIGELKYKLFGDFTAGNTTTVPGNDAIKISANGGSKEISFVDSLVESVGFIAATESETAKLEVSPLYDDGTTPDEEISFDILPLTSGRASNNKPVGKSILKTPRGSGFQFNLGTVDAYLNAYTFELDLKELNKVSFINNSQNDVYILAISTIKYDQDAVITNGLNHYDTYKDKNFTDLDSTTIEDVKALLTALELTKDDVMYPVSTQDNIDKFTDMIRGYELWTAWMPLKNGLLDDPYCEKTEDDFETFPDSAKNEMLNIITAYEAVLDKESEYIELTGLCEDSNINMVDKGIYADIDQIKEKYATTKDLYDDYLVYLEVRELESENAYIYAQHPKEPTNLTDDDLDELLKYEANCNRLIELGVTPDSEKLEYIKWLIEAYKSYTESEMPFIPVEMNYDTDIIGKVGETVGTTWATSYLNKEIGINGGEGSMMATCVDDNNILEIHEKGYNADPDTGGYGSAGTYYKYYLNKENFSTNKNDSVSVLNTVEKSFKTSGRPIDKIAVLRFVPENSGGPNVTWTINYTDGTTATDVRQYLWNVTTSYSEGVTVRWYGYRKSTNGNDWERRWNWVGPDSDGKLVKKADNDGAMAPYVVEYIDIDETKSVEKISVKSAGSDNGNIYLLAITEIPLTDTQLENKLDEVKEKNYTKEDITSENVDEIKIAKRCADELVFRLKYNKSDFEWIYNLSNSIFTADASFEKVEKDKVFATIEFTQAVNIDDFKRNLKVEKVGTANYEQINENDYTIEMLDKKAVIKITDKFYGGVQYKISILENLSIDGKPEDKILKPYEFVYTSPAWIVFNSECIFEKIDKDTFKSTITFTQPVTKDKLEENISVLKNGQEVAYDVLEKDEQKLVIAIPDEPFGNAEYKVGILGNLTLKDYPEDKIPKMYEYTYNSKSYLTVEYSESEKSITVKNNTSTPYNFDVVITEISEDNTEIIHNSKNSYEVSENGEKVHSYERVENSKLFISIWDDKQKLILDVTGGIKATTSETDFNADYTKPTLDATTNVLKIAGFTKSKGKDKNITLDIFRNDTSFIKTQALTNKDGYFEIVVPLNDELMTDDVVTSGSWLSFSLGGDEFEVPVTTDINKVYYAVKQQKIDAINTIINPDSDEGDIEALLKSHEIYNINILQLDPSVYKATGYDLAKAAVTIYKNKALFSTEDDEKIVASIKILEQLLVLSAFNQSLNEVIEDDNSYLLHKDIMNYKSLNDNSLTLYSVFEDLLTEKGREEVISNLQGKDFETVAELINNLAISTANSVLNNCSQSGYVKYTCLLTTQNATKLGIDISNYTGRNDKTALLSYLTTKTIDDIDDLETYVKTYVTPSDPSDFGGGGSFGGGSSPGSSSGGFEMTHDVLANQDGNPSFQVFNDLSANHWAYSYIADMKAKNIMNGDEKGNVNPDNNITRAEFIKILVASESGTELDTTDTEKVFNDVEVDDWYFKYVVAAFNAGIIMGDENGNFNPNAYITREDMCVMLYRMAEANKTDYTLNYNDGKDISDYALGAVAYLSEKGIINGFSGNLFKPKDNATRAQCAKIISMYLSK